MRSIRGGMGIGDALYVQAVARHLVQRGERLKVCTAWPDVFRPLGDRVEIAPFTRAGINVLAHYSLRRPLRETTQFEDCCIQARIREPVELKLDWVRAAEPELPRDKPIICVQMPRAPMGRTDGFAAELLPDCKVIQGCIDRLKGRATVVQIGAGASLFHFSGIDHDLTNRTTVAELFDVASAAHGFLGYCSFIVPLAESFDRPLLAVWSRRGLQARHSLIRQLTPAKVLHKKTSRAVIDDDPAEVIDEACDALLR